MKCPYAKPTITQCNNCHFDDCVRAESQDVNEQKKEWIRKNPDKRRAIRNRYYQNHKEQEKEGQKRRYQLVKDTPEYKEKESKRNREYRARKKAER